MKLQVPFFPQTTIVNCGPSALRMALAFLDKDPGLETPEDKCGIKEGKGVFTIQLAIAAASLGYKAEFYSKQISFNRENLKLEFYQKYADLADQSNKRVELAKSLGVHVEEKILDLDYILSRVNNNELPIILLDWNIVKAKDKGYQGHFVPIVGYDEENIYVHNHSFLNPEPFLAIKKDIFETARKAAGTDEDIVIISRRSN